MAVDTITTFTPKLVTAISDHVQTVSDHCLAKGLISNEVYRNVLESTSTTNEAKARTLLMAVKATVATKGSSFRVMMQILKEVVFGHAKPVPASAQETDPVLIKEMKRKYKELTRKRRNSEPSVPISCGEMSTSLKSSPSLPRILVEKPDAPITVASKLKAIEMFTPKLVTAISYSIEGVLDECHSELGLISGGTYQQLIEFTSITREERARKLLLAVKETIRSDDRCFKLFLNALHVKLPTSIGESLVSEIKAKTVKLTLAPATRQAMSECAHSTSGSATHSLPDVQREAEAESSAAFREVLDRCIKANNELSILSYQKEMLEIELRLKIEENDKLKAELSTINAEGRESECAERVKYLEAEIAKRDREILKLKETVREKEEEIEERRMSMKRERAMLKEENKAAADLRRENRELEAKLRENLKSKNSQLQQMIDEEHQEKRKLQQDHYKLVQEIDDVRKQYEDSRVKIRGIQQDYDKLKQMRDDLCKQRDILQTELDVMRKHHSDCIVKQRGNPCLCSELSAIGASMRYCPRRHTTFDVFSDLRDDGKQCRQS